MSKEFGYSAKNFFDNNLPKGTGKKIFKLGIFFTLLAFIFLGYNILAYFLPSIFAFLTLVLLFIGALICLCRTLTFPGSSWFWKRRTENYFQRAFIKKVQFSVILLNRLLECLDQEIDWDNCLSEEELSQIRMMISSLLGLFQKQEDKGTLTKRQKKFYSDLNELQQLLFDTIIINKADQKEFSVWSLLEENSDAQDGLLLPNALLHFQNRASGNVLFEKCQALEKRLESITEQKGFFKSLSSFFLDDIFGTIHQVREEMNNRFDCQNINLQVEKGVVLDCVFIPGRTDANVSVSEEDKKEEGGGDSNYYLEFAAKGSKHLKTTVVICCPSTTYYEYVLYENEWIDLYLRNGVNIFLWNYRGYGRSTGKSTIKGIKKDGEFIIDYLRREMGIKKLGAHGEAVGGVVAAHLAKTKKLDFLFIDRNLADLSRIGELAYGKLFGGLYKYLTLWSDDICSNYLESNCYKVLTFDPKDVNISVLDSMQYWITSRMIANKLNVETEDFSSNTNQPSSWISNLKKFRSLQAYNKRVDACVKDYYELLGREQMVALFWALYRISELFDPLSAIHNLPVVAKANQRAKSIDDLSSPKGNAPPIKFKHERRSSLDSSMNMSMFKDEQNPEDLGHGGNKKKGGLDDSVLNESRLNETIDMKNFEQFDDGHLVKSAKKKSYVDFFEEDAKNSPEVIGLLVKIFAAFENLEAGGIQINDALSIDEEIRFEVFLHFINCFEFWGSCFPLEKIIEDEPANVLAYNHANGVNKVKEFVKRINSLIQKQKAKPIAYGQNRLVRAVLDDLEIINSIMPTLYQKLSHKAEEMSSYTTDTHIQIEIENSKNTKEVEGGKFMALSNNTSRDMDPHTPSNSYLGSLLPIGIWTNETLKQEEIETYEFHLRNSQMI